MSSVLDFLKNTSLYLLTGAKTAVEATSLIPSLFSEAVGELAEDAIGLAKAKYTEHKLYRAAEKKLAELKNNHGGELLDALYRDILSKEATPRTERPRAGKAYAEYMLEGIEALNSDAISRFPSCSALSPEERADITEALLAFRSWLAEVCLKSMERKEQIFVQVLAERMKNEFHGELEAFKSELKFTFYGNSYKKLDCCPACQAPTTGSENDTSEGVYRCKRCGGVFSLGEKTDAFIEARAVLGEATAEMRCTLAKISADTEMISSDLKVLLEKEAITGDKLDVILEAIAASGEDSYTPPPGADKKDGSRATSQKKPASAAKAFGSVTSPKAPTQGNSANEKKRQARLEKRIAKLKEKAARRGFRLSNSLGIISYTGRCSTVRIPKYVTAIGFNAFRQNLFIKSVIIPDSVTVIEQRAFADCTRLKKIKLGKSLAEIGECAFYNCTELEAPILPEGLEIIEAGAFQGCYRLREITLPESLMVIGKEAFAYTGLGEIIIPNGVGEIGEDAFCLGLNRVILPDSYADVSEAFRYLPSLKCNEWEGGYYLGSETNPYLLFMKIMDTRDAKTVKIHPSTRFIHKEAFDGSAITGIVIPDSVISIGSHAFDTCRALADLTLGKSLRRLGDGAFYNCNSLRSVTLPEGLLEIGANAFECTPLHKVSIPRSVEKIGESAFNTAHLHEVMLPKGYTVNENVFPKNRNIIYY